MAKQWVLIDADDTLWENNIYFERAFDEFVQLQDDLVQDIRRPRAGDRHARRLGIHVGGRHDEGLDVVATAAEDLADAHQDAGLVVDEEPDRRAAHLVTGAHIAPVGGRGDGGSVPVSVRRLFGGGLCHVD